MTQDQLLDRLRDQIARDGHRATAERLSISPGFLSNVIAGRSPISQRLAEAMGYRREMIFRRVR